MNTLELTRQHAKAFGHAAGVISVPCGAANDTFGGVAHLVEHLVLRRVQALDDRCSFGAVTSRDLTMFHCVTTSDLVDQISAKLLDTVTRSLQVTPNEIEAELKVIDVEDASGISNREILGKSDERLQITCEEVNDFHRRYYNATATRKAIVSSDSSPQKYTVTDAKPTLREITRDDVHLRFREDCAHFVFTQPAGDAQGAALLLDLARRIDPMVGQRISLPTVEGYARNISLLDSIRVRLNLRIFVHGQSLILVVRFAQVSSIQPCISWIDNRLRNSPRVNCFQWSDPLKQARWQAYWDMYIDGGYKALESAFAARNEAKDSGSTILGTGAGLTVKAFDV